MSHICDILKKPEVYAISRPSSSSFHYQGLWWRHLALHVGKTKDQGLYSKPSAAVHLGALTAGTLTLYNTVFSTYHHSTKVAREGHNRNEIT